MHEVASILWPVVFAYAVYTVSRIAADVSKRKDPLPELKDAIATLQLRADVTATLVQEVEKKLTKTSRVASDAALAVGLKDQR